MKYIRVKIGDDLSLYGQILQIKDVEGSTVVLQDKRSNKTFTHGLETFKRTIKQGGYEFIEEEGV